MKIAVLGTGTVGQTLAGKLSASRHEVTIGTRDPKATLARNKPDNMGNPPFSVWKEQHPAVGLDTLSGASAKAELIVNATSGGGSIEALTEAGEQNLNGKVLIDVSNPLDFSRGFPPSLSVSNTDSLAEQIQRRFPQARVVKALNTMTASLMLEPDKLAAGQHTVLVSGNDADAKATVTGLLKSYGWSDIIDLGDITTARGTEMYLPLWVRMFGALGNPMINIKVVR
jgi:8-hydroxy-5-deazaflavin:NADPH oxidoreductase